MLTLAFDTATPSVTVAVADGSQILADASAQGAQRHGEVLAPAIAAVLEQAGLQPSSLHALAVGVGPGPFTGLRVGLVTARTMSFTLGIPVAGVCTLDLLAAEAVRVGMEGEFLAATDARRKEVYWATYDAARDGARTSGPHVSRPDDVNWRGAAIGAGTALYPAAFPDAGAPLLPTAAELCRWVADGRPTLEPVPLYLRRPDAVEPAVRKPVSGAASRR